MRTLITGTTANRWMSSGCARRITRKRTSSRSSARPAHPYQSIAAVSDFVSFCRSLGIIIDHPPPVGVWRRYKTVDKPTRRNGSVKFLGDAGFAQNHALQTEVAVWRDDRPGPRSVAPDVAAIRRREAQKRAYAITSMREKFFRLPHLRNGHPYLERKGLSMMGCGQLRTDADLLVIPMFVDGRVMSFQTIAPDGTKKYRVGCPVKGASFLLTRRHAVVTCLTEGFATGLAVYQAMPNASVLVCFDAGNMVYVAKALKVRGMAVVCADNDYETEHRTGNNPGIVRGREAAESIGCGAAWPSGIAGTDWCDFLQERGEKGSALLRMHVMRHAKFLAGP